LQAGCCTIAPVLRRSILLTILFAGVAIRIYAYLRQPSMWIDEVAIVRNVIDRSLWQLVSRPLDFGQVAPVGYLAVVKGLVTLFGPSELILRLPSLFGSVAARILVWRVAEKLSGGLAAIAATATVVFSPVVLYTGAEVKPYSTDFAMSLAIVLMAVDVVRREDRLLPIAAGGAAAVWFSQHAILTAAGAGLALALLSRNRRVAIVIVCWGASATLALAVSLHDLAPSTAEYMRHFWAGGFLPLHGSLPWLWEQIQFVFIRWSAASWQPGDVIPKVYAAMAIAGFVAIARRKDALLVIFCCLAITIAVSATRWYPFPPFIAQRLILFESSLLILIAAAAVERLTQFARSAGAAIALTLFVLPTLIGIARCPPPYKHDMTAEMLAAVRARWRTGDILYANSGVALGVLYYAPQFGFHPAEIVAGECSSDPRTWLHELDRLRGRRIWLIVNNGADQRRLLDFYLSSIGQKVDAIWINSPGTWESSLIRPDRPAGRPLCAAYEVSSGTNADRFEIPSVFRFYDAAWWCFGVFKP
jgi:hypothetical protein